VIILILAFSFAVTGLDACLLGFAGISAETSAYPETLTFFGQIVPLFLDLCCGCCWGFACLLLACCTVWLDWFCGFACMFDPCLASLYCVLVCAGLLIN
jgi:uncharacterized membrane protein YtjA (UPF0391 family)